jgi:hypothetical protein
MDRSHNETRVSRRRGGEVWRFSETHEKERERRRKRKEEEESKVCEIFLLSFFQQK